MKEPLSITTDKQMQLFHLLGLNRETKTISAKTAHGVLPASSSLQRLVFPPGKPPSPHEIHARRNQNSIAVEGTHYTSIGHSQANLQHFSIDWQGLFFFLIREKKHPFPPVSRKREEISIYFTP